MKNKFQLTAIAVALASLSGGVNAVESSISATQNDQTYGNYQRLIGKTSSNSSNNGLTTIYADQRVNNTYGVRPSQDGTLATAPTVAKRTINGVERTYLIYALTDERRKDSFQTTQTNNVDRNITQAEEASIASKSINTSSSSRLSGTAINNGEILQQIQLDAQGAPVKDAQGNYVTVGNKFRAVDSSIAFNADDQTKVGGATKNISNSTSTSTTYKSGQALASTYDSVSESISEGNAIKYGTDGKPVQSNGTTDYLITGTHKNNNNSKSAQYQSGKSELASTNESTSDISRTDVSYNYKKNGAGQFVDADGNVTNDPNKRVFAFTDATADGKNARNVSSITDSESKLAYSYKDYQPNQVKEFESAGTSSSKTSRTDVFDGFISSSESTSSDSFVDYGNAKNALDYEGKSSFTSKSKSRSFERNADGTLVLKDGKPVVKSVSETNANRQSEGARFEASEYQDGDRKGQDKVFLNNGINSRFTDDNLEHSFNKSSSQSTRTDAVDGFVANNNFASEESFKYARNLQENIEVARDLGDHISSDVKDISRNFTYTTSTGNQVVLKDVNRKINGDEITANDVRVWSEIGTDGKETKKYFVVLGHDLNGEEIREEVGFVAATSNSQKANLIVQTITDNKATEKVYPENGKVFYDKTQSNAVNVSTNVQGAAVGERNSNTSTIKTTLYTRGNDTGLDYETAFSKSWDSQTAYERDVNGQIILVNGKPVIKQIEQQKGAQSITEKLYQVGQAKTDETISARSWDNKTTDVAGNVLITSTGHDNTARVNYAKGQELDSTFTRDAASEDTAKAVAYNVGYDYTGTAKVDANGRWLTNGESFVQGANAEPKAGIVVVDSKTSIKNTDDTKVYQAGSDKAYTRNSVNNESTTYTYTDGKTGIDSDDTSSTVIAYNKGKNAKYRESNITNSRELNSKTYQVDADGDLVLKDGKAVEVGNSATKTIMSVSANDYQLGQALKSDSTITSNTVEKITTADSVKDKTVSTSVNGKTYRSGEFLLQGAANSNETRKTTSGDVVAADYAYATNTTTNAYRYGEAGRTLLAQNELDTVTTSKRSESLTSTVADGKKTVAAIERNNTATVRSDESNVWNNTGKSVNTNSAGVTVQVDDSQIESTNKFGNYESTVRNTTTATTQADKSSVSNSITRTDDVAQVKFEGKTVTTDKDGKATTAQATTVINAGGITTGTITTGSIKASGGVDLAGSAITNVKAGVTDTDAANVAQMKSGDAATLATANTYTTERFNNMSHRLDDVEKTAYRGVAISLAAQQAIPNLKPGNFAVYGGLGHYEGETAVSVGAATLLDNGRTSISAALGVAGSEVGGRVGVSYVFGE